MGILTLNNSIITLGGSPLSIGVSAPPPPATIDIDIDAYWCVGSGCMTGDVYLKCCAGNTVCTCNISTDGMTQISWSSVSAGCYYVDFSDICGLDDLIQQVVTYGYYSDCFNSLTESKCTDCFGATNYITYELYDMLY